MVNPFRFLAYHKIYFDHYRNLNVVSSTLRYRNCNKDYFTSLSPSFQGADYLTDVVDMSSVLNLEDGSN